MKPTKLKFTALLAMLALLPLVTASCASDDPQPATVPVTFIAHLPATIDSRAIADGEKANELFFWVYDESNNEIVELRRRNIEFNKNTNTSKVTANLQPGHTYSFAFWAQHKGTAAYDPADSNIKINYGDGADLPLCNDDDRDAFYGWIPGLHVSAEGSIERDITLSRFLAQVNVGLARSAAEQARAAGLDLANCESSLTVYNSTDPRTNRYATAYTAFAVSTGDVPAGRNYQRSTVGFDFNPMPDPDELLSANGRKWAYLAMTYFQPVVGSGTGDRTLVNVDFKLRDKTSGKVVYSRVFPNVNVRGTERTNLLIGSLTDDVAFEVVIDENFDNLDINLVINPED